MSELAMYADATGFFDFQLKKQWCAGDVVLNLLGLTGAPPSPSTFRKLGTIQEHVWQMNQTFKSQPERVRPIASKDDLNRVRSEKRVGVFLTLQSPPEDRIPTVEELLELRQQGVLFMTLAYDTDNRYGGGFAGASRLTNDGKVLMDRCASAGITVDLAHANHATAAGALQYAQVNQLPPVVATHTASYDLYNHPRNLPADILQAIAQQEGFVGVVTLTSFLHDGDVSNEESPAEFARHFAHVQELCGRDHTAIGSDGYYRYRQLDQWKEEHIQLNNGINPDNAVFGVIRWPDQPQEFNCPDRMERIYERLVATCGADKARYGCGIALCKWLEIFSF